VTYDSNVQMGCYEIFVCPFEWTGPFVNGPNVSPTDTSLDDRNCSTHIYIYITNVNK
jgi:hypothetical protein